ncbi:restriction endonuclease [Candidatus Curtissbacteria bacterium]|nr:restriction endonuclease [Candidatus Curtissbacteria bacterium]
MANYRRYRRPPKDNAIFWVVGLFLIFAALAVLPLGAIINSDSFILILVSFGLLVGVFSVGFLFYIAGRQQKRLRALRLSDVDSMEGVRFEDYVAELLKFQGYKIEKTLRSGDLGVDLIAKLGADVFAVQVKRHRDRVDRRAISDAVAGMRHYHCNKSMVVTNSFFQPDAKKLALSNDCVLIDREKLTNWIFDFTKGKA